MEWVPVIALDNNVWLGLVGGSQLYTGSFETPNRAIDVDLPIGLLPLLERPLSVVIAEIDARERTLDLAPGALRDKFNLEVVPHVAAEIKGKYWPQLALDWLADLPSTPATDECLALFEAAEWAPPSLRDRAAKLRRKSSRGMP